MIRFRESSVHPTNHSGCFDCHLLERGKTDEAGDLRSQVFTDSMEIERNHILVWLDEAGKLQHGLISSKNIADAPTHAVHGDV